MRIAVTGDSHLDFLHGDAKSKVVDMVQAMADAGASVSLCLGDMTNGKWHKKGTCGLDVLLGKRSCLYVLGNHDLWNTGGRRRTPDWSLKRIVDQWFKWYPALPLETSMDDDSTVVEIDGVAFVGTIGLADFRHPRFVFPASYYNKRNCTNDGSFIDMTMGWRHYSDKIAASFAQRLKLAANGPCKTVVVGTHYPIFEEQYRLSGDDMSAYFFFHQAGLIVRDVAAAHPDKKFWCFAAHAHDFCRSNLLAVTDNVAAFGVHADYGRLTFVTFDLDAWVDQTVTQEWFPELCKIVVESRVVEDEPTPPTQGSHQEDQGPH